MRAPTYALRDPTIEPWYRDVARWLDNGFDAIVGAPPPARFVPRAARRARRLAGGAGGAAQRRRQRRCCAAAPDGTPYIAAAQRIEGADRQVLLLTVNARDMRRVVRAERYSLLPDPASAP